MKISDITYKLGVRDTADASSVSIDPKQPFEISKDIYRLAPNKHQLLAWVMKKARTMPTGSHKFGHLSKAPLPTYVTYSGSDETSSQATTGLTITLGSTRLDTAYRLYNTRTGEIIRLNAAMSGNNTGAVDRNFGTSGAPYLLNGDKLKLLTPAHPEGRTMGKGLTGGEIYESFTTEIVDWPVQLTGTKAAERNTDGSAFANALSDSWESSADQMESTLLLGAKVEDDSSYTYPMHASQGLLNWISSNVWSLDGWLTRMELWSILAEWKTRNKEGGAIGCSGAVINMINSWAFNKVVYNQDLVADGIDIQTFTCPAGTFDLVEIDLLNGDPYLEGTILLLPNPAKGQGIDYRPLIGEENRDIGYKPVNRDEIDMKEGVIFGEYGYEFWGEEQFGVINGLEF